MWIPGDWMSVSTMPIRLPMRASETARLAVVFDLPVPPRKEWIEMMSVIARLARARANYPPARLTIVADGRSGRVPVSRGGAGGPAGAARADAPLPDRAAQRPARFRARGRDDGAARRALGRGARARLDRGLRPRPGPS